MDEVDTLEVWEDLIDLIQAAFQSDVNRGVLLTGREQWVLDLIKDARKRIGTG